LNIEAALKVGLLRVAAAGVTRVIGILVDEGASLNAEDLKGHGIPQLATETGDLSLQVYLPVLQDTHVRNSFEGVVQQ
jgi:hypothetical protein